MSTKGKPQRRERSHQKRVMEIRSSNAASPFRNRAKYSRKDKYKDWQNQ